MQAALATFVFWFVVWQVIKRDGPAGALTLLGLGVLIGVSAMGVATILFAVPLVLAAIWFKWTVRGGRFRLRFLRWRLRHFWWPESALAFALRDPQLHHRARSSPSSAHSGVNFWIGNNPHANGYPKFPPGCTPDRKRCWRIHPCRRIRSRSSAKALRSLTVWFRQAKAHPRTSRRFVAVVARKISNFWNGFQDVDLSIITNLRENGIILPGLMFGFVAALGLPGMVPAESNTEPLVGLLSQFCCISARSCQCL